VKACGGEKWLVEGGLIWGHRAMAGGSVVVELEFGTLWGSVFHLRPGSMSGGWVLELKREG